MTQKILALMATSFALFCLLIIGVGLAEAAPAGQSSTGSPESEVAAPSQPSLRILIHQSLPVSLTIFPTSATTQVVTTTQPVVLDLVWSIELPATSAPTMSMPASVTIQLSDAVAISVPFGVELGVLPEAQVNIELVVAASLTDSVGLTETAPITGAEEITDSEEVTTTDAETASSGPSVASRTNLRGGPGLTFPVVGSVGPGQTLGIVGISEDGQWYLLADDVWVASFLVIGAPTGLPVVALEASVEEAPAPTQPITATEEVTTTAPITETPALTATQTVTTPEPAAIPALVGPTVLITANLRGGPGVEFPLAGSAGVGQPITVVGRNEAGDWYLLDSGVWIFAELVQDAPADIPLATDDGVIVAPAPAAGEAEQPVPVPTPTPGG